MDLKRRCIWVYSATFVNDNGTEFQFGLENGNIFDADIGSSVEVTHGTSQGFSQIGETIVTSSIKGRTITIKGQLLSDIPAKKEYMRRTISPFATGKLVMQDGKYINVNVNEPPSFSAVKNDGKFMIQLFAQFPYFYDSNISSTTIGGIIPKFKFPVNYSTPHKFGEKIHSYFRTINNTGEIASPINIHIEVTGTAINPIITNVETFQFLKINGTYGRGSIIDVYRDRNNVLRAELSGTESEVTDIINNIEEDSTLYEIYVGKNIISANDDNGGTGMAATISYNIIEAAWYESEIV